MTMSENPDAETDVSTDDEPAPDAAEVAEEVGDIDTNELEAIAGGESGGAPGMMQMLQSGGLADLLTAPTFEDPETGHTYSQADLVSDVINVMRLDTKQMAALHDVDIEVDKMTPERAAQMLEEMATNDGYSIIEVFEEIEDQRDEIMQTLMTDEQHRAYNHHKRQMLHSIPDTQR